MVNLNEADALFDEAAGEQASSGEWFSVRLVEAIKLADSRGFRGEIGDGWDADLHAGRKLVAADASLESGVAGVGGGEAAVLLVDPGEGRFSRSRILLGGRVKVGNRGSLATKERTLCSGGQKAIGPLNRATPGMGAMVR